jgi:cyclophilin family peptidyl-prolyl cis-trans isomerase
LKTPFPKLKAASLLSTAILSTLIAPMSANATVVEFDTSHGKVKVSLYDETTPTTVANFLSYVADGSYNNTIFHRDAKTSAGDNFIIQGGSYYFDPTDLFKFKPSNAPIRNEPIYSNVAGTIAMAKTSSPNSATRQWFFNLNDNSTSLDIVANSGGFTVFGQVIEGYANLAAMAEVNRCFYNGSQELPFVVATDKTCSDYTLTPSDDSDKLAITTDNFITVNSITITDATVDTVSGLTLPLNELLDSDADGEVNTIDDDDDGDGVLDVDDLYPFDPTESADSDGDGSPDNTDKFPDDSSEQTDFDEDGTGDNADLDDDNDGVEDTEDAFPFDDSETTDSDNDGVGDNADEFPNDPEEWRDLDKDGVGDNADACPVDASEQIDTDGDGYCDGKDKYPEDASEYLDTDLDGIGDNADDDDDGDGVLDVDDYYPKNPDRWKNPSGTDDDSGGSLSWFALLSLGLVRLFRRK